MARAEAKYTLKADDRTAQGIRSAEGRLKGFTRRAVINMTRRFSAMRNVVAGIGGAFIAWGTAIVRATGDLDDMAKAARDVNASVSEMAELQLAAKLLGADPDQVLDWFTKIQRKALEATQGLGEAQRVFKNLGLDAEQVQKLGIEDTLVAVASAAGRIEGAGRRTGLLQQLGVEGRVAGRVFAGGGRRVLEAFGEAERLGVGTKMEESADRAERFSDAWAKVVAVSKNFYRRATASEGFIQALENLANRIAQVGGTDTRRLTNVTPGPSMAAQAALRPPDSPKESTQQKQAAILGEVRDLLRGGAIGGYKQ